ncbi:FKBP-type peptidyl-prolyl cis-trans isomerase [Polaribacter aquimarinus]|uniref:Peptidyl-prolyl cis-trans isomerase n=1 Tax=Polaribacter aquimarinus TaxID=2100726 RepID=A0A2U2JE39_9FLAO|nr:FKBP-type peptidyl-prolyl cis-trans isomerase [Polaribacter aquimarinus]PWG06582.1 peptidylprolyl isomerase [Polaribacter aquimarinus]
MKPYLLSVFVIFLLSSCIKDDNFTPQTEDDIKAYIAENNLTAKKTNSGLYYVIQKKGTGTQPTANSNVRVAYKGYFLDKNVFDQSSADGITFNLQQVIRGWTEGIQLFKEGGEGILIVPYQLGYGSNGRGGIPGGAVLVFDIKLISVN